MISNPGGVRYGAYHGFLRTRAFFNSDKNQLPKNEAARSMAAIFNREINADNPIPPSIGPVIAGFVLSVPA